MNQEYMKIALLEAKKAFKGNEVPVGAVIVKDGKILGKGNNRKERKNSVTRHAEIEAIERAGRKIKDWRLDGCDIYVTLEPCCMCAGAIISSRIERVFIGAMEKNFGCAGSCLNLLSNEKLGSKVEVETGILEEESVKLLQNFFRSKR